MYKEKKWINRDLLFLIYEEYCVNARTVILDINKRDKNI